MAPAFKHRAWLNRDGRCFDIANHSGVAAKLNALGSVNIAAHLSVYNCHGHLDVGFDFARFGNDKCARLRKHDESEMEVDPQRAFKFELCRGRVVSGRSLRTAIRLEVIDPRFKV